MTVGERSDPEGMLQANAVSVEALARRYNRK